MPENRRAPAWARGHAGASPQRSRLALILFGALALGWMILAVGRADAARSLAQSNPMLAAAATATPAPQLVCLQDGQNGYAGTADAFIDSTNTTTNYGSETRLRVISNDNSSTLLSFDLSSIPVGAQVVAARLRLAQANPSTAAPLTLFAYQVYRSWNESQTTWIQARTGVRWGLAGCNDTQGDRSDTPISEVTANPALTYVDMNVMPLVQLWVSDPSSNRGLILKGSGTSGSPVTWFFWSSETLVAAARPQLCVEYLPPLSTVGHIAGIVWEDQNANRARETGEPPLAGARVDLWRGQQLVDTETTGATGTFSFEWLQPDAYTLIETDPAGYVSTTGNNRTVVVRAGETSRVEYGDRLKPERYLAYLPMYVRKQPLPTQTPTPTRTATATATPKATATPTATQVPARWYAGAGLTGQQVNTLLISPASCALAYAGADNQGVYRTLDGGSTWQRRGLDGTMMDLALAADGSSLYAVTWGSGVHYSTDGGLTWSARNAGLQSHSYLYAIVSDGPRAALYVGTADAGVYKSLDGGAIWLPANAGLTDLNVRAMAVDAGATGATLYVGTKEHGLFRSTDDGTSWQKMGLPDVRVREISSDPRDPYTLYVATDDGVFRSTDGGITWPTAYHAKAGVQVNAVAVDGVNSQIVHLGTEGDGVYISTNAGASWTPLTSGMPAEESVRALSAGYVASAPQKGCPQVYAGTRAGAIYVWK